MNVHLATLGMFVVSCNLDWKTASEVQQNAVLVHVFGHLHVSDHEFHAVVDDDGVLRSSLRSVDCDDGLNFCARCTAASQVNDASL
jgi:hypothetical protein